MSNLNNNIRVIVADRQPVFLRGLTSVLREEGNFDVVASCSDGPTCIRAIRDLVPDVALLDIAIPRLSGLEILATVTSERLHTRVLLLSSLLDAHEVAASAARGGYGVIPKDASPESLVRSLRQVACGRRRTPPALPSRKSDRGRHRWAQNGKAQHALALLTEREREIVELVSEGLSNKEVGYRLDLSDGTIKVHLHNIYQKLAIHNRTTLASFALLFPW